jgi:hypothetical protein
MKGIAWGESIGADTVSPWRHPLSLVEDISTRKVWLGPSFRGEVAGLAVASIDAPARIICSSLV